MRLCTNWELFNKLRNQACGKLAFRNDPAPSTNNSGCRDSKNFSATGNLYNLQLTTLLDCIASLQSASNHCLEKPGEGYSEKVIWHPNPPCLCKARLFRADPTFPTDFLSLRRFPPLLDQLQKLSEVGGIGLLQVSATDRSNLAEKNSQ